MALRGLTHGVTLRETMTIGMCKYQQLNVCETHFLVKENYVEKRCSPPPGTRVLEKQASYSVGFNIYIPAKDQ